ncbi:MAG: hypothetical protein RLT87_07730 [Gammaproteobacteria bacterium]
MKIEFETDINGYQEARKFISLIDTMLKHEAVDASLQSFAMTIRSQLEEFISRPEFSQFEAGTDSDRYSASHDESPTEGVARFMRFFMGPSRREQELSRQRYELIERAERAENSAFEALAETATVGRERDDLKARLKQLEAELAKYREKA